MGITDINWGIGIVRKLSKNGQAWNLGVKPNWRIIKVNDLPYTEKRLDNAASCDSYFVTFETRDELNTQQKGKENEALEEKKELSVLEIETTNISIEQCEESKDEVFVTEESATEKTKPIEELEETKDEVLIKVLFPNCAVFYTKFNQHLFKLSRVFQSSIYKS